jgi:GT2 family glycosyltransferase
MMVKRQVFQMAGMFCEDYFMYGEDVDLCYKVARAGFANWYVGDATVIHCGGKSSVPMAATVMKWRSLVHYCAKNRGWLYALAFRIAMAFAATARLVIIAGVSLFGRNLIDRNTRWSVGAKWRAIFKTLLLPADSARVVLAKNAVEQPPS